MGITILLVTVISILLTGTYILVISKLEYGWKLTPTSEYATDSTLDQPKISIIVAARNEELRIEACVESILQSSYQNFELIVVDNGSDDETLNILKSIVHARLTVLSNSEGFKKESLDYGIKHSSGDILVFTDADCLVKRDWLLTYIRTFQATNADMILGPIQIQEKSNRALESYQTLDMMAMMGITAGGLHNKSIYLSNGGNFAIKKEVFQHVGGFPNRALASGDDVLLLHAVIKAKKYEVHYLKDRNAIVSTFSIKNWSDLFQQRKRWASKTSAYIHSADRNIAIFIFLFLLSIIINIILIPFSLGLTGLNAIVQLMVKAFVDYKLLRSTNKFFQMDGLLRKFIPSFFIQLMMFLWSGFSSIFSKTYVWKGRNTR